MSALAVGVSADGFGLWGASSPSEVRARLQEGGRWPQLQVRAGQYWLFQTTWSRTARTALLLLSLHHWADY